MNSIYPSLRTVIASLIFVALLSPFAPADEIEPAVFEGSVKLHPIDSVPPSTRGKVRLHAMSWLQWAGAKSTREFGLKWCDDGAPVAARAGGDLPIVVFVHGFNSTADRCANLIEPVRAAGFRCAAFSYPNDQAIVDSARFLSRELKRLARENPKQPVILLTYSMGGLIARETVENDRLDPGNVERLVMVAPPSHGSTCAKIACSGDLYEHGVRRRGRSILDCVYASIEDGLGEARHDLKPDSSFLRRLNARPRNPRIRYSIFLGTGSPYSPEELARAKEWLKESSKTNGSLAVLRPALDRALDNLADAVEDGDGVVSLARGRLEGVDDTVLMDFNHWNVIDAADDSVVAAVHREILKRLSEGCESPVGK